MKIKIIITKLIRSVVHCLGGRLRFASRLCAAALPPQEQLALKLDLDQVTQPGLPLRQALTNRGFLGTMFLTGFLTAGVVFAVYLYVPKAGTVETPATKTGAKPETSTVARHDCPGCEHKYVTEGHGKAKTDKIVHVCKMCGSEDAFCCVMKKGAGPKPGMEKK